MLITALGPWPVGQVGPEAGHLTVTRVYHEHPTPTPLFVSFPDLNACLTPVQLLGSYPVGQGLQVPSAWDSPSLLLMSQIQREPLIFNTRVLTAPTSFYESSH